MSAGARFDSIYGDVTPSVAPLSLQRQERRELRRLDHTKSTAFASFAHEREGGGCLSRLRLAEADTLVSEVD